MPRKPQIPFGDKRRAELNRVNANISRKQKNLEKRFGMRADFEKKSAADFSSIAEFNEYIESAKHFTKRTANRFDLINPEGQHIGYRNLAKVEKEIKRINKIKEREFAKIKHLPHKEHGRPTGLTIEQASSRVWGFGDKKFDIYRPIEFKPTEYTGNRSVEMDLARLKDRYGDMDMVKLKKRLGEKYIDTLKNRYGDEYMQKLLKRYKERDFIRERHEMYFDNYLKTLHSVFNESSHPLALSLPDDVWDVHDAVVDMGVEGFIDRYYRGELPSIGYLYSKEERMLKLAELRQAFGLEE
jgi:hypothetical protein